MIDINSLAAWANVLAIPITIAGIVIAALISLWIYRNSKPKFALSCIIDPVAFPIEIKAGEALKGEIEIRYKKRAVKNLSIVRVNIKNTGNSAIRRTNIVEDIAFIFPDGVELLRTPVAISKKPDNLSVDWRIENPPNKVYMLMELFNPDDEITIEFLCAGLNATPKVMARIEGLKAIGSQTIDELRWANILKASLIVFGLFILCILGFAVMFYYSLHGPTGSYLSLSSSLMYGYLMMALLASFGIIPCLIFYYLGIPVWKLINIRKKINN